MIRLLRKPSTQKKDADDGDGDAATIFQAWPSPSPNARSSNISRKGKHLSLTFGSQGNVFGLRPSARLKHTCSCSTAEREVNRFRRDQLLASSFSRGGVERGEGAKYADAANSSLSLAVAVAVRCPSAAHDDPTLSIFCRGGEIGIRRTTGSWLRNTHFFLPLRGEICRI